MASVDNSFSVHFPKEEEMNVRQLNRRGRCVGDGCSRLSTFLYVGIFNRVGNRVGKVKVLTLFEKRRGRV